MRRQLFRFPGILLAAAIPLLVGGISAILTKDAMTVYGSFRKPPLSPPSWIFPVVWTMLYLLMGAASYLIIAEDRESPLAAPAISVYTAQLIMNFFWSLIFFRYGNYLFAFLWLIGMEVLITANIVLFWNIRKSAGLLMIPLAAWTAFAGYLNFAVWLLSKTPTPA